MPHTLTGVTDERGIRYSTYEYNADGEAIASHLADNVDRVDIQYFEDGSRTLTNSKGVVSTYTTAKQSGITLVTGIDGPGCSTCSDGDTVFEYDAANNLTAKVEQGVRTEYGDFDENGQYTYEIEAVGASEERRIDYTYDSRFFDKIATITEPSVYASGQKVTTYTYDDFGNRLSETVDGFTPDGTPVIRATSYVYAGPLNQISQIDGPCTDVVDITQYRYYPDDAAEGDNRARLKEIEDANGVLVRSNIQYTATGQIASEDRANGLSLTYTYYAGIDRLETLVETDTATGDSRITRWTYLATGEVETITQGYGTADATIVVFSYDDARRLTRITDGLGNYLEYTLDTENNKTAEQTYDANGVLTKTLSQTFDIYNRLDLFTEANDNRDQDYAADGTLDREIDGQGTVTDYSYDALRRLTQVVQDLNGLDPLTANATTTYNYDTADRLTSVTDPNGNVTSYVYDDLGNLLSQTSPDTGTTTYSYDSAGNLLSQTDALARTTGYSYDALNRLTQISYNDGTTTVYSYDQGQNALGLLDTITDTSGATGYAYDPYGRITAKTHTTGILTLAVAYHYNAAGQLDQITYPSGSVIGYSYSNGLITAITVDGQPIATDITYIPFGPPQSWTWGNGTSYSRSYELDGRVASYGLGAASRDLSYGNTGNLTAVTDPADPSVQSAYGYDALYRLTDFSETGAPLFSAPPTVLGHIQSLANESAAIPAQPSSPWLTTAVDNITSNSVQLALERSQVNDGTVTLPETIGYLAVEQGKLGTFTDSLGNDIQYETIATDAEIIGFSDGCTGIFYAGSYAARPLAVATKATHLGNDGGWLRQCGIGKASVGLLVDEDTFLDGERAHGGEAASVVVFSQAFHAELNGPDATPWHLEAGSAALNPTAAADVFTSVTFQQIFTTPPIVLALPTNQGTAPTALRVRNITTTGFEIVQVEPPPHDGPHNAMTVHYIAIEPGVHQLPDGTWLDAGSVATTAVQRGVGVAGVKSWHTQAFSPKAQAQGYGYDANGNRTSVDINGHNRAYTIDAASNRLTAISGAQAVSYTHDAVGNTLSDGRHSYAYDDANRLVSVNSGATTYTYNGLGQRVLKQGQDAANGAVYFAYGEAGQLVGEYDATGVAYQETVWLGNLPIAVLKDGNVYYIHADQLNTPRVITDVTDTVVWRWESDPFGATAANDDPDGDGVGFVYNLRFPGQYYDQETGLYYNVNAPRSTSTKI